MIIEADLYMGKYMTLYSHPALWTFDILTDLYF